MTSKGGPRRSAPRPGNGRKPGFTNPNAGRRSVTSLNNLLALAKLGAAFSTPATLHADVTIGRCTACGAVWWEPYNATLRGSRASPNDGAWQADADENGDHHPVIASIEMAGHGEIHKRNCVFYQDSR